MKILKVIHGYPPLYNAGSEVYSQTLCQNLADRHEVQVFTREENLLKPEYAYRTELDASDPRILLHIVNSCRSRLQERYRHNEIDDRFGKVLDSFQPDVVHIGHLNHLSTSLVFEAKKRQVPMVFTLHDYWVMCPRGQFIQRNSKIPSELCEGQSNKKCAKECYSCRYSGSDIDLEKDRAFQEDWIDRRMNHIREVVDSIDCFIAPSRYLMDRFIQDFGLPNDKTIFLDYGFDCRRLSGRERVKGEPLTFGYIGTHIQSKGIQDLIHAFGNCLGEARLRIWGRERDETKNLQTKIKTFPPAVQSRISWMGEYENPRIVQDVFNQVDMIIVPSIWVENSPLVIHEALQTGVPVLTADAGGMREFVAHEVNGLLFKHRDAEDLKEKMQRVIDNPSILHTLSQKRYLQSETGDVVSIGEHITAIEEVYRKLLRGKNSITKPGPWRITFDTNPDHCNYSCVMCEGFSPYSDVKRERVAAGIKPRVMKIELIRKIMQESKGSPLREIIPSTMGEPLIYKDFDQIIDLCHEYQVKLNLTTNGSFPIKGVQKWAELIVPVASDVKISWNGATKKTHENIMIGSKWEEVTANLETFIHFRDAYAKNGGNYCSVTLQLTFLQSNVDELADIVQLGIDYGVDRIKGHHLWAHFDEIQGESMRRDKASIVKWNHAVSLAVKVAESKPLANGKKIRLENIYPLDTKGVIDLAPGGPCPFLGKEAWVNTAGKFSPCCAPDKLREKLGNFGQLTERSLEEIWESDAYRHLRKNYIKEPLCIGCNMRKKLDVETI